LDSPADAAVARDAADATVGLPGRSGAAPAVVGSMQGAAEA